MKKILTRFKELIDNEDKKSSVKLAIDLISKNEIEIVDLYEKVLRSILNDNVCHNQEDKLCIWREHTRTAIVRSIIECAYPYLLEKISKNKIKDNGKKVVVLCPDGETHELGARMVSDYFELNGFSSLFIGSSTPLQEFLDVIEFIKPDYVAISVTNPYNLVAARKTINEIERRSENKPEILLGGYAFNEIKSENDYFSGFTRLSSFDDIKNLEKEGL
jgi:methanogenic corrinoid protein MtbC1